MGALEGVWVGGGLAMKEGVDGNVEESSLFPSSRRVSKTLSSVTFGKCPDVGGKPDKKNTFFLI